MNELKKAFNAARAIQEHNLEQAADHMDYSLTTINKFFSGDLDYPDKVEKAIRAYINKSGIIESIDKLKINIDPNSQKKKVTEPAV